MSIYDQSQALAEAVAEAEVRLERLKSLGYSQDVIAYLERDLAGLRKAKETVDGGELWLS